MTQTENTTSIEQMVDGYFAMWNEQDAVERRAVIAQTWSDDARYVDPMFEADSRDGLDALVAGVHQQFPGHEFRLVGAIDAHHDCARWGWELVPVDGGAPVAAGVDFARLAADGRLQSVTGFFQQPA
jgi:hypothetical protein